MRTSNAASSLPLLFALQATGGQGDHILDPIHYWLRTKISRIGYFWPGDKLYASMVLWPLWHAPETHNTEDTETVLLTFHVSF